jgi:hypothetical protein
MVSDLCVRHPGFPRPTIERMVTRAAEQYRDATVTAFVSVLVYRHVAAQLHYVMSIPSDELRVDHGKPGAQPAGRPDS